LEEQLNDLSSRSLKINDWIKSQGKIQEMERKMIEMEIIWKKIRMT